MIYLYGDDHLPPHFHAKYAEFEASINIKTGEILKGYLPSKQLRLVQAWTEIHCDELLHNYETLHTDTQSFNKIKPLE